MVDMQKAISAATLPIIILIIVGVVDQLVAFFMPLIGLLLAIPVLLINLAIGLWVGYRAVKEFKLDIANAALTGGIAGGVSSLIGGIVGLVLMMVAPSVGISGGLLIGVGVVALIIGIVVGLILGAILAAIGAFLAGMMKK
jgi:hypothetical protein